MHELPSSGRVYTSQLLSFYDLGVHGLSNGVLWRCPTGAIHDLYSASIRAVHLDIGVATGYLLDHCTFPTATPQITLLDINPTCLHQAAARLHRYQLTTVQADALQSLPFADAQFHSVGLGYLLHCLPGTMMEKTAQLFPEVHRVLAPGGVLFGTTVLGRGERQPWLTRQALAFYNRVGVFTNRADDRAALDAALGQTFVRHTLTVIGSVALFTAVRA